MLKIVPLKGSQLWLLVLFVGGRWKFANNGGVTHLNPLRQISIKNLPIKNLPIKHIFNKRNTSTNLHKKLSMKNTFNKKQWWCYPPESTSTDLNKTLSIKNLPMKHIFNKKTLQQISIKTFNEKYFQ